MKILVAVPTTGMIPVEFINSIDRLRTKHDIARLYIPRSLVHVAREQAVETMIESSYEAVLFIDDDMVFEPDLIDRLVALDSPVASAACFKRIPNYDPCFYDSLELRGNSLYATPFTKVPDKPFDAVAAGCACMMIKKEVFQDIKPPYFLPLPKAGEDLTFCFKLAQSGFKIRIDPSIRVGHLETRAIYQEHWEAMKK